MRQFLKTSFGFVLGLSVTLAAVECLIGRRMARLQGRLSVSPEIYMAIERASERSASVHSIILGDSVAHQLFPPRSEEGPDERFLTCNQAGSLAAQYYILADAVGSFPELHDAFLLYYPGSFENNLGPPYANDYFCGFFHTPAQIREVFELKRDARLTLAQTGRLLLPNILAINSYDRPMAWERVGTWSGAAPTVAPPAREPLADLLDAVWGRKPSVMPPPRTSAGRPVFLSRVSQYYLPKMRELCRSHGIAFHVLPCPCSAAQPFNDARHVYERAIIYLPPEEFGDGIHVREPFRDAIRQRLIAQDNLPSDAPQSEPVTARPADH